MPKNHKEKCSTSAIGTKCKLKQEANTVFQFTKLTDVLKWQSSVEGASKQISKNSGGSVTRYSLSGRQFSNMYQKA